MSDNAELKVTSKESVAFKLAILIVDIEEIYNDPKTYREKLLDIYAECLDATSYRRDVSKKHT